MITLKLTDEQRAALLNDYDPSTLGQGILLIPEEIEVSDSEPTSNEEFINALLEAAQEAIR